MEASTFNQSSYSLVTLIVAPAMLTNASSVLALSTINRMLRTRDRMSELFKKSEAGGLSADDSQLLLVQTARVELQASHLLNAMRAIYLALGSFVAATLVTLLGAVLDRVQLEFWTHTLTIVGLGLGVVGVFCLITGSLLLFRATRLSLANIREEAERIRARQKSLTRTLS